MVVDPDTEILYRKVMWAAVRLMCYIWIAVILAILQYFLPIYNRPIEPFIQIALLLVGLNVGRYRYIYIPRKGLQAYKAEKRKKAKSL